MSIKLYEVTCKLRSGIKKIQILSKDENFNNGRINRELFGKNKNEDYQIIKFKVLKENLGL